MTSFVKNPRWKKAAKVMLDSASQSHSLNVKGGPHVLPSLLFSEENPGFMQRDNLPS